MTAARTLEVQKYEEAYRHEKLHKAPFGYDSFLNFTGVCLYGQNL